MPASRSCGCRGEWNCSYSLIRFRSSIATVTFPTMGT